MRTHLMDSNTHSKARDGSRQVGNSRIGHPFQSINDSSLIINIKTCEDMIKTGIIIETSPSNDPRAPTRSVSRYRDARSIPARRAR